MLKHLYIKNYALIEELDMDFQEGFSVITGETGAGKSILLGAIGLLLGQRADSKSIQTGASRCVIEAEFYLEGFGLETFFSENDFDFEGHTCTLRRELTSAGKSRAFINDTPATVAQLKELGSHIIDIHSQHQNLLLANENFQMEILDILGNNEERTKQYSTIYQEYKTLEHALEKLKERINSDKENEDYLRFQLKQLSEFNPVAGEDETLQEEAETLSHAEDIKSALFQATERMSGEQYGIVSSLRQVLQTLQSATRHYPAAEEWHARVEEAYIQGLILLQLGQEDRIGVRLATIKVLAIAGEATEEHTLILLIPIVDWEHNVALVDTPSVWQCSHKRRVNHIPLLTIVLLLLVNNTIQHCTTFTYSITTKLCKNIWFRHIIVLTNSFHLRHNLFNHIFIVKLKIQVCLDRHTTTNIERIELRTNLFQVAIQVNRF